MALAPLHQAFGLEAVTCVTMQAVSGAGYPGVPSLDILGNVIPDIGGGGEEAKIASEPQKILEADFPLSVAVNRVPVVDGHTVVDVRQAATAAPASTRSAAPSTASPASRSG